MGPRRCAHRLAASLAFQLCVGAHVIIGASLPAFAQSAPAKPATAASTSIDTRLIAPLSSEVYVDRVMADADQLDQTERKLEVYNTDGWPRGISLQLSRNLRDSRSTSSQFNTASALRTETTSLDINAYIDTPNYGSLSLQALMLGGGSVRTISSWSVRQAGLPFDGGWFADNTIGVTNLLMPDLARRSSRIPLPIPQVQGASTSWRTQWRDGNLQAGASVGEPGRFVGFPQSRFDGTGGRFINLFAQTTYGPWTYAATVAQGERVILNTTVLSQRPDGTLITSAARGSPVSTYLALARTSGSLTWQLNAIGSRMIDDSSLGLLFDANWRREWATHNVSVFRFERDLSWLDRPLPSDLQGAAYRYAFTAPRWDASANIEAFRSVSGATPSGYFGNFTARRQLNSRLSVGGGAAARKFGTSNQSAFVFTQWQNSLGASRLQFDVSSSQVAGNRQAVIAEQTLFDENSLSLSTTLSVERIGLAATATTPSGARQRAITPGLNTRWLVADSLSLSANVLYRTVTGTGGATSNSNVSLNIGLDWAFSSRWSLNALIYENRGVIRDVLGATSPLAPTLINTIRPNDRGVFIGVRYGASAGTPVAPLGGKPGSGFGRLDGTLYFDGNDNAIRDASEKGVGNVVVVLDGRYSTRTDASGNFSFATVASGTHYLSVVPDDLPLPWSVDPERKIEVEINTREVTRIDIGARRIQ